MSAHDRGWQVSQIQSSFSPLVAGAADVPDDLYLIHERGCNYLRMPVAKSDDGLWLTVVDVGLTTRKDQLLLEGREPFTFDEFGYEITLMPTNEGDTKSSMDRTVTQAWLPANFSSTVLEVVGACCRSLLKLLEPQYIYRVTYMSEPTEKALKKHEYVTNIMESLGYLV